MSAPDIAFLILSSDSAAAAPLVRRLEELYPGTGLQFETCARPEDALRMYSHRIDQGGHIPLVIWLATATLGDIGFFRALRVLERGGEARLMLLSATIERHCLSEGLADKLIDSYLNLPLSEHHFAVEVKRCVSSYFLDLHPEVIGQAPSFVSHLALHKALDEVTQSRQKLASELHSLKSGALLRTLGDQSVLLRLGTRVADWLLNSHRENQIQTFEAGQVVLGEGTANDGIWFVLEGEVAQEKMGRLDAAELLVQGVGEVVGLLSLLSSQPAFATIRAKTACRLARLSRENLDQLLSDDSEFLVEFLHALLFVLHNRVTALSETKVELQESYFELKQTQTKLVESEKMATIGVLTAGIAHELNNPSAALARSAEHLRSEMLEVLSDVCAGLPTTGSRSRLAHVGLQLLKTTEGSVSPTTTAVRDRSRAIELSLGLRPQDARRLAEIELMMGASKDSPSDPAEISNLHRYLSIGRFLNIIQSCSERISRLVIGMKDYAAAESQDFVIVDIRLGIQDTALMLGSRLNLYVFETHDSELQHPNIRAVPAKLNQVWTNLLVNACDATATGGSIGVRVSNERDEAGAEWVVVTVSDSGVGIPSEIAPRIFEPRFTTKTAPAAGGSATGLGLGLAIVKKIITDHGGTISFRSQVNVGTEFCVRLRSF